MSVYFKETRHILGINLTEQGTSLLLMSAYLTMEFISREQERKCGITESRKHGTAALLEDIILVAKFFAVDLFTVV